MAKPLTTKNVFAGRLAGESIGDGLLVLPGQGNSLTVSTDAGLVMLDPSGFGQYRAMFDTLREHTDETIHAFVYSHGHMGYSNAIEKWDLHNDSRQEPRARRIAHSNVVRRFARYAETRELQARMVAMQFPGKVPLDKINRGLEMPAPSETFDDHMVVVDGPRRVEVIWTPSEVDDSITMWLPDDGLVCPGSAFPGHTIPNIGTPLRTQRFTVRWADSLDRIRALGAERMLTEFGSIVEGAAEVERQLSMTAEALRWIRAEVVKRLNAGMDESETLASMSYPAELFDQPWMRPTYGAPDYIVRDLYREENGWWDRNPTTLHPLPTADAADAVRSVVDPQAVLAKARQLAENGETQAALHVIDLLALASGDDPEIVEARNLKAELCIARAVQIEPFVSRSLYQTTARLLEDGSASWTSIGAADQR